MHEITIPKLNNNDLTYVLVEWLREDGQRVTPDTPVAVVETSKATQEILAGQEGVLRQAAVAGTEWPVGAVIGRLFVDESEQSRNDATDTETVPAEQGGPGPSLTDAAQRAVAEFVVSQDEIRSLGRKVVRRKDIELLVARRADSGERSDRRSVPLSRSQAAVARAVTASHREIPTAFMVIKVHADVAIDVLRESAARHDRFVGLPDLLIMVLADGSSRFPLFYASLVDERTLALSEHANIGVTVDVGKGLFVPVVRPPRSASICATADTLLDFRAKAMTGSFTEDDLAGGNIVLSLHTESDIVLGCPIVFPGHTAVVCLCAVQHELYRTDDGDVASRAYFNLVLGYDHRVINGRDAAEFLRYLKSRCEQPGELVGLAA